MWIAALAITRISPAFKKPALIASSTAIVNASKSLVDVEEEWYSGGIVSTPQNL